MGAATLGIGSSYITQTTTAARRQVALGRYRITQNIARMCGPFVGFLFLGLPEVRKGLLKWLNLWPATAGRLWRRLRSSDPRWAPPALQVHNNSSTGLKLFNWWACSTESKP